MSKKNGKREGRKDIKKGRTVGKEGKREGRMQIKKGGRNLSKREGRELRRKRRKTK